MKNIYISSCDRSGGIYHYRLTDGNLTFMEKTPLDRPMYTVFAEGKLWVLLREIDENTRFGGVMSFDVDANGALVNPSPVTTTGGICPCHLAVSHGQVYMTNYLSGNVTTAGGIADLHKGIGKKTPHTHFITPSPDGKYLLSCDLGLDSIFTYGFDLSVKSIATVPEGCGPRHLAYSDCGRYVYCINELSSSVTVFRYNDGVLERKETYSCLANPNRKNSAAAIRMRDGYLYASNRGEDTIVCFKAEGETLRLVSRTGVGGSFPRDFNFAENRLLCTNEHTNNVSVFSVEGEKLTQVASVENMADPLCVTVL